MLARGHIYAWQIGYSQVNYNIDILLLINMYSKCYSRNNYTKKKRTITSKLFM
ncbi:hypothetical protein Hanom_Chr03g00262831 [Helianthus anomalus]